MKNCALYNSKIKKHLLQLRAVSGYASFFALGLLFVACGEQETPMQEQVVHKQAEKPSMMLGNSQITLANIRTQKIGGTSFSGDILLKGTLESNPEAREVISSRYSGRIEKLFIKEDGIKISKGTPIFSIYSEELLALQQDYLLNLKQQETFPNEDIYRKLTQASLNKLRLYGISTTQIANISKNRKADARITVFAPISGIVKEISVTEGSYIAEGSPILMIENLTELWLEADVYPSDLAKISTGKKLIAYINGYEHMPIETKIDFVSPQLDENSQKVRVRASIPNKNGNLQTGMYVQAKVNTTELSDVIKLPVNAVIRDESYSHVWIKSDENTFEPRLVTTGAEDEGSVIIQSGLSPEDEVVVSGVYLLYSEYKLKKGNLPF